MNGEQLRAETGYDQWLWGKKEPFCSLSGHMIAVGACAMEYLSAPSTCGLLNLICAWMNMPEDDVIRVFAYVASLHDIGKAHPSFEPGPFEVTDYPVINYRHEQYGADCLRSIWMKCGWDSRVAQFLAAVVRLHHQGKGICNASGNLPEGWTAIHRDLENRMRVLFEPPQALSRFNNMDALGVTLTAILILCDWIASSEAFGAWKVQEVDDVHTLDSMRSKAKSILTAYGLISDNREAYPRKLAFNGLWSNIPVESMRPVQRVCEAIGGRRSMLTIIEAPMGEGKTEAALYIAGRLCELFDKKGIYMALPTAATSNQMVGRVREMLNVHESGSVRLMHSMAWLVDNQSMMKHQFVMDETEDAASAEDWLRPLRRGMLSENAVGTVDQAMSAVLRVKYGFLRLAGLAQKVLIIDEIHAYDIFMSTIISRMLEWCRALDIPVVMLSATLQDKQKRKYLESYGIVGASLESAYPLVTQVTADGELYQTPVPGAHMRYTLHFQTAPVGSDVSRTADLVQTRAARGGCICAMMNTVKQAQALYREFKARGETDILLFHARFTAKRRAEIERECLSMFGKDGERPARMILVCTQVVEQSLDVDFDWMITQLAPMDLLLQRAGRVHRHAEHRRPAGMEAPTLEVILPEPGAPEDAGKRYGRLGGVYPIEAMKNTEEILGELREAAIPEDVRACVERAYRDIEGDELPFELVIRKQLEDQMKIASAEGELLTEPEPNRFFAQIKSRAASLALMDTDENLFVKGTHTRDGGPSQRFAFLPADFPEQDGSREWLRHAMEYSCNINLCLTNQTKEGNIEASIERKSRSEIKSGCIMLKEDEQGFYQWQGHTFSCTDEYGIEEVSN